jgi:hypothetical protein
MGLLRRASAFYSHGEKVPAFLPEENYRAEEAEERIERDDYNIQCEWWLDGRWCRNNPDLKDKNGNIHDHRDEWVKEKDSNVAGE